MKKYAFVMLLIVSCFAFTLDVSAKGKNELSFKNLSQLRTDNIGKFIYYQFDVPGYEKDKQFYILNKNLRGPDEVSVLNPPFKLVKVVDNSLSVKKQRIYVIEKSGEKPRESSNKIFERYLSSDKTYEYYLSNSIRYVSNAHGYSLFLAYETESYYSIGGVESIDCSFETFEKMFLSNNFVLMKEKAIAFFEGRDKQYFNHTYINTSGYGDVYYIVRKNKKGDKYQYTSYVYTLNGVLDCLTTVRSNLYYASVKSPFESIKDYLSQAIQYVLYGKSDNIERLNVHSTGNTSYEFKKDYRFKISPVYTLETSEEVKVVGADIFNGNHSEMMEILFSGTLSDTKNKEIGKELTAEDLKKKIEINNNVNIDNTDTNTNNNADNTKIENNNSNSNNITNDSINNIKQDTEVKSAFEQTKSVLSTVKNIPQFFSAVIDMFPGSIKTLIFLSFTLLFIAFILKIFL